MKPCYTLAAAQEAHEEIGLALLRADEMPDEVVDGLQSALANLSTVISDLDTEAQESAPPVSPDPSPFQDVSTWEQGDRLRSFRGELAVLLSVTRQCGPGRSAKVWVMWLGQAAQTSQDRGEYYADVFTNETRP